MYSHAVNGRKNIIYSHMPVDYNNKLWFASAGGFLGDVCIFCMFPGKRLRVPVLYYTTRVIVWKHYAVIAFNSMYHNIMRICRLQRYCQNRIQFGRKCVAEV